MQMCNKMKYLFIYLYVRFMFRSHMKRDCIIRVCELNRRFSPSPNLQYHVF